MSLAEAGFWCPVRRGMPGPFQVPRKIGPCALRSHHLVGRGMLGVSLPLPLGIGREGPGAKGGAWFWCGKGDRQKGDFVLRVRGSVLLLVSLGLGSCLTLQWQSPNWLQLPSPPFTAPALPSLLSLPLSHLPGTAALRGEEKSHLA